MAKVGQRPRANGLTTPTDTGDWISDKPETIIVQPTTLCNLDCSYCYLPDRKKKRDMTPRTARAIASSIPAIISPSGYLEVVWHGGEPLAIGSSGLVGLLENFESLRNAGQIRHMIQTNATLINDEWCDLFMTYDISVGVSVDGPRVANHNRIDWRGLPVFDRIVAGLEKLKSHNIPFTVIAVVGRENTGDAQDILNFFAELECPFVGFNMEEKEGVNIHSRTPTMDQAQHFWRDVFLWNKSSPELRVREVDRLLGFLSLAPIARHADGKHDLIPTVAWNGDVVVLISRTAGSPRPSIRRFYRR